MLMDWLVVSVSIFFALIHINSNILFIAIFIFILVTRAQRRFLNEKCFTEQLSDLIV